jgi:hypothetical protein
MNSSPDGVLTTSIDVKYRCNATDYVEALRAHRKAGKSYRIVLGIGTLFLVIGSLEIYVLGFAKAAPAVVLGLFCTSIPFLSFSALLRRDFYKHPNLSREYMLHADEAGLRLTSDVSEEGGKWAVYTGFRETPNLFVLYYGARTFLMIPKRAFEATQQSTFRGLLSRNVRSN